MNVAAARSGFFMPVWNDRANADEELILERDSLTRNQCRVPSHFRMPRGWPASQVKQENVDIRRRSELPDKLDGFNHAVRADEGAPFAISRSRSEDIRKHRG